MKNLNRTIEKATMPNLSPVTSVNRKFLYSLCIALCLVTCSLLTRAKGSNFGHYKANPYTLRSLGLGAIEDFARSHHALLTGSGSGHDYSNAFELPYTLGFGTGQSTYFQNSSCTSCSPMTQNYGDPSHSGNDMWVHINLASAGYLTLRGGTADFDSFFYLLDSSGTTELAHADDGNGSASLQPLIQIYLNAGNYYLVVDGTDKTSGWAKSGTVLIDYGLTH